MITKEPLAAVFMALFFCITITSALAQEVAPPKTEATPQAQRGPHLYRLDYTLAELENGKKIDSRQYSISVGGGPQGGRPWSGQVQIGTKVPGGVKSDGATQYLDVGTRINSFISMREGVQVLDTDCDVSSMAPDETKVNSHPILRTFTIRNETPIMVGKVIIVATADDPNSKRKFQLEVTVTEIK